MIKKFRLWAKKQQESSARERVEESLDLRIINSKIYITVKGQPCVCVENSGNLIPEYNKLVQMAIDTEK